MSSIAGAIFPISSEHAANIFENKKNVFVNYTRFSNLVPKHKIIFYVSKEKILIGEAKIEAIVHLDPDSVLSKFQENLFLKEKEFRNYSIKSTVGKASNRKTLVTVFKLRSLKKFRKKVVPPSVINATGRYITMQEYNQIVDNSADK